MATKFVVLGILFPKIGHMSPMLGIISHRWENPFNEIPLVLICQTMMISILNKQTRFPRIGKFIPIVGNHVQSAVGIIPSMVAVLGVNTSLHRNSSGISTRYPCIRSIFLLASAGSVCQRVSLFSSWYFFSSANEWTRSVGIVWNTYKESGDLYYE